MEELLTQASVAVELLSFSYLAGSLALYSHQRFAHPAQFQSKRESKRQSKRQSTPQTTLVEPAKPTQPVKPAKRSLSPVEQLRQQCQQAGIKWRDAHGKNKHLKKHEMLAALSILNVIPIRRNA